MQILTSIHFSNQRYFCIRTHCVQPLKCLCPCKCTHFEPLCIHAYIHKYRYIVWWTLLYKNPRCGNSHKGALTVRTSLFTCKYSQVYMFQIKAPFVYKPIVCKLTYVCALANAHTSNLVWYMQMSTNIHFSCDGHFCTRTYGAETHIWLCPCKRSHLEPLCVHKYSQVYIFQITDASAYRPSVCKLTYVCAPRECSHFNTSLYTCKYPEVNIYIYIYIYILNISYDGRFCTRKPTVWKLTYVYALASAHS